MLEIERLFEIEILVDRVDLGIKFSGDVPCELILPERSTNLSSFNV
ncbi:hypothetical protein S7335_1554 [Synechococcus sp. PCC 7335]|nr:hypothetical protein S7335_1554 [Synechococcus sp. PCC 7335]